MATRGSNKATIKDQGNRADIRALRRKAHRITTILHQTYGSPDHNNKTDPLDELIFIILSLMTTHPSFNRVYDHLKEEVGSWENLLRMPLRRIKSLIKDAGLSHQKGPRIKAILKKAKADFGEVSLSALHQMSDAEAEEYLTSLPGVGLKAAKCVMMYSLGRKVLPVDTHVWRVARRLGLVDKHIPYPKIHNALEKVVPPEDRYSFHVNALTLGREVCLSLRPKCPICPVKRLCSFYKETRRADK
jgi:endonuclease III